MGHGITAARHEANVAAELGEAKRVVAVLDLDRHRRRALDRRVDRNLDLATILPSGVPPVGGRRLGRRPGHRSVGVFALAWTAGAGHATGRRWTHSALGDVIVVVAAGDRGGIDPGRFGGVGAIPTQPRRIGDETARRRQEHRDPTPPTLHATPHRSHDTTPASTSCVYLDLQRTRKIRRECGLPEHGEVDSCVLWITSTAGRDRADDRLPR